MIIFRYAGNTYEVIHFMADIFKKVCTDTYISTFFICTLRSVAVAAMKLQQALQDTIHF